MLTRANAGKWSFPSLLQAEVAKIVKKREKQPKAVYSGRFRDDMMFNVQCCIFCRRLSLICKDVSL